MSEPLITPAELGTLLNIGDSINTDRAAMLIKQAQSACESVINPIPESKMFVLYRVVARAYLASSGQARGYQLSQAGADQAMPSPFAGVQLTGTDRADLLSSPVATATVGSSAFTIHTPSRMPEGHCLPGEAAAYWRFR